MILDESLPLAATLLVTRANVVGAGWHGAWTTDWLTNGSVQVLVAVATRPSNFLVAQLLLAHVIVWH